MGNVKIHFAVTPSSVNDHVALHAAGVNYMLYTCYPYICKKSSDQDMTVKDLAENRCEYKHAILDSGLFTLMFGAKSNAPKTTEMISEWMMRIVKFVIQNNIDASIVECDCQKIISPEFAWELRRKMRELLPGREIINVFHLEDGEEGFRRLVDFADYIAISVPELRINQPKNYKNTTCALARMARRQKPTIKIHLLGCTEKDLLQRNLFCTTADSSSWSAPYRFGRLGDLNINCLDYGIMDEERVLIGQVKDRLGMPIETEAGMRQTLRRYVCARTYLDKYRKWCGNQD